MFDAVEDVVPTHMEALGHLFPTHSASPATEKPLVFGRQRTLACGPRNSLDLDAACRAIHATHCVYQHNRNHPQWDEIKTTTRWLGIASATSLTTT